MQLSFIPVALGLASVAVAVVSSLQRNSSPRAIKLTIGPASSLGSCLGSQLDPLHSHFHSHSHSYSFHSRTQRHPDYPVPLPLGLPSAL